MRDPAWLKGSVGLKENKKNPIFLTTFSKPLPEKQPRKIDYVETEAREGTESYIKWPEYVREVGMKYPRKEEGVEYWETVEYEEKIDKVKEFHKDYYDSTINDVDREKL